MANLSKTLAVNVDGEFFVDNSCINCDTCRQLAPEVFDETNDSAYVYSQPLTQESCRNALRALIACPTGSIGTRGKNDGKEVMNDFPLQIEGEVFFCGFNSPKSYGGNSYFIQHPNGNWLIDSPKFLPHLKKAFEDRGGIQYIFLTHRDDVADAQRYAEHFQSKRIIHRLELQAQPGSEIVIDGNMPVQLFPEFKIIPTFGHTRGHCALLYRNHFLFTGDHLWWSRKKKGLSASEEVCWYSWTDQIQSMENLMNFHFSWILPGHGQRIKLESKVVMRELELLVYTMKSHFDEDFP